MARSQSPSDVALRKAIQQRAQRTDNYGAATGGRTLKSPAGGGIPGMLQDAYGQAYGQNLYGQTYSGDFQDPMQFIIRMMQMLGFNQGTGGGSQPEARAGFELPAREPQAGEPRALGAPVGIYNASNIQQILDLFTRGGRMAI